MVTTGLSQIGLAFCYLVSVETAALCFPKHIGLVNSILLFVSSVATMILNVVDTIFVNPDNRLPDLCVDLGTIDEW